MVLRTMSAVTIVDERLWVLVVDRAAVGQRPDVHADHEEQQHAKQKCEQLSHHSPGRTIGRVEFMQLGWLKFQCRGQRESGIGAVDHMIIGMRGHRNNFRK